MVTKTRNNVLTPIAFGVLCVLACSLAGCSQNKKDSDTVQSETESKDSKPITILILDANQDRLAPLKKTINQEFDSLDLGKVTFQFLASEDFLSQPVAADVVFYPPNLFGTLVKNNLIRRVPDYVVDSEAYAKNDILGHQRRRFCYHDETRYALSLGTSGYYLFARTDLLEANGLTVPQTWVEYQECCQKLAALKNAGKLNGIKGVSTWSPSIEPMNGHWLSTTFVARSASYVRTRGKYSVLFDYSSWSPLIQSVPFERTLDEIKTTYELMDPAHQDLDPWEVEQAFVRGESAFAISWPHPPMLDDEAMQQKLDAGIFALPGSLTKYDSTEKTWKDADSGEKQIPIVAVGGFCGSVLTSSQQSGVAIRRLGLLAGKDFSKRLAASNSESFPYRASHLAKIENWIAPQYSELFGRQAAEVIEQQNRASIWVVRPRVANATRYEATMAAEIRNFFQGQSATKTLENIADRWREINKTIDPKFQQTISLESMGIR